MYWITSARVTMYNVQCRFWLLIVTFTEYMRNLNTICCTCITINPSCAKNYALRQDFFYSAHTNSTSIYNPFVSSVRIGHCAYIKWTGAVSYPLNVSSDLRRGLGGGVDGAVTSPLVTSEVVSRATSGVGVPKSCQFRKLHVYSTTC